MTKQEAKEIIEERIRLAKEHTWGIEDYVEALQIAVDCIGCVDAVESVIESIEEYKRGEIKH